MGIDKESLLPEVEAELDRLLRIEDAATKLFTAVWRAVVAGRIPDRSPIDDAALLLRDALNPNWPSDSDWLPEPLATERAEGKL
jgi:hypothetical protein